MKRRSRSNHTDVVAVRPVAGGASRPGGAPNTDVSPTAGAPIFHSPAVGSCAPRAAPAPEASIDLGSGSPPAARATVTGSSATHLPGAGDYPWWQAAAHGSSNWTYPPSGFLNFIKSTKVPPFTQSHPFVNYPSGSQLPENFHFVGSPMSQSTMSPTVACSKKIPSPTGSSAVDAEQMGLEDQETIDVVDDDTIQPARLRADARTDRRLNWSNEEDIRLVSAWLHNSIDPVGGNDKKSDQYWYDVTSTYNSSTKCDRVRNRNQLKLRWERIKKPVTEFNGCYARISKVHQSGMSDDQKMDQALQLYASEHSDKPFTMMHVWRVLRHEQKWSAYVKRLNNEKDKSATCNPAHVVNVEDDSKQRPVGHKKAKGERNGKHQAPEAISAIDKKLDKFIEVSNKAEKMAEVQQNLANKKLEVAKLNHEAAQEQTKSKMVDLYKELLCAPTNDLSEEALAQRTKAMESMRLALFAKDN